jgi:hypothetical protein
MCISVSLASDNVFKIKAKKNPEPFSIIKATLVKVFE